MHPMDAHALDKLRDLGCTGDPFIAVFPPFPPDDISTCLAMACHREDGIDLLAQCSSVWYNPALAAVMRG